MSSDPEIEESASEETPEIEEEEGVQTRSGTLRSLATPKERRTRKGGFTTPSGFPLPSPRVFERPTAKGMSVKIDGLDIEIEAAASTPTAMTTS
ncbi:MAG: hypothetical protein IBX70_14075, partial [Clostridia bacterium]|nr:hypothetical protein [Clostridia bacterium]